MNTTTATKVCRACGIEKPLTDFHRHNTSPDGRRATCRTCRGTKQPRHRRPQRERLHSTELVTVAILKHVACFGCRAEHDVRLILDGTVWTPASLDELATELPRAQVWCRSCDHTSPRTRAKLVIRTWADRCEDILKEAISDVDVQTRIASSKKLTYRFGDHDFWYTKAQERSTFHMLRVEQWEKFADPAKVTQLNDTSPVLTRERNRTRRKWEALASEDDDACMEIYGESRKQSGDLWSLDPQ